MKKLNVAIWGLGRAGIGMQCGELKKFAERFNIHGGYDPDASRGKIIHEQYGAKAYAGADEMLNDPELDIISIATRSTEHAGHAVAALNAGKYVFLEKPIAITASDLKILQQAAAAHPGKLFVRHNRRFEAGFVKIMEIVKSGLIGELFAVKLRRLNYQRRNDWQTLKHCGGGQLNNWGPHIIDHSLQFLGCPVAEVWNDLKNIAAAGDAEDHLKIIFKGENGRIVDMEISGGCALNEPEYILHGSRGSLILSSANDKIKLKYLDRDSGISEIHAEEKSPELDASFANPEKLVWIEEDVELADCKPLDIWKHLYDAIVNNVEFPVTLQQSFDVVKYTLQVKNNSPFGV